MVASARAESPEEKEEVLRRILKVWQETFPTLRLGQLLMNIVDQDHHMWLIEDKLIAQRLEEWVAKAIEKSNKT